MSLKKPKVLSLKDKVYILELLQKGYSVSGLARKYGVAKFAKKIASKRTDAKSKSFGNSPTNQRK